MLDAFSMSIFGLLPFLRCAIVKYLQVSETKKEPNWCLIVKGRSYLLKLYIQYVRLSRNLYILYVRLRPTIKVKVSQWGERGSKTVSTSPEKSLAMCLQCRIAAEAVLQKGDLSDE